MASVNSKKYSIILESIENGFEMLKNVIFQDSKVYRKLEVLFSFFLLKSFSKKGSEMVWSYKIRIYFKKLTWIISTVSYDN